MQDSERPQPAQAIGLRAWCIGSLLVSQADLPKKDTTMRFDSHRTRHTVSPKRGTAKPRLEVLEELQLLSGFGPADGAYIVENRAGGDYRDVQIQPVTE